MWKEQGYEFTTHSHIEYYTALQMVSEKAVYDDMGQFYSMLSYKNTCPTLKSRNRSKAEVRLFPEIKGDSSKVKQLNLSFFSQKTHFPGPAGPLTHHEQGQEQVTDLLKHR